MNENHTRGMLHCKLLTALAIATLLTGSNIALATETNSENINVITEQTGEPVIGASVLEKGTNNGIVTNIDGKFSLTVNKGAVLVISFIGYKTQETKAAPNMEITLIEDAELLEEVVVVAMESRRKN